MVVVVSDLEEAIENFSSLGFLVERGGVNGPTHNALIFFRDGTYIELISTISLVPGHFSPVVLNRHYESIGKN